MTADRPVPVRHEREGDLSIVTIDSPPLNLFDENVFMALEEAMDAVEADLPRCVLFRAEGRVVSGGVDVKLFDAIEEPGEAEQLARRLLAIPRRLEVLPVPTVFAAHSLTLTAAFELALGCDIILAAESAKFGLVERVVALTPFMGGTQRLVERAGPARARELVYTGELFDAQTLERWNVVNRVYPDAEFAESARRLADHIAAGPPRAHAATKRIVRAVLDGGVEAADGITPENARDLFATEDTKAAVSSFLTEGPGKARFSGH
jgi:enoyl-CoA hydratase/carnithine racemase